MKCLACGKERKIFDCNVCKKCFDEGFKIRKITKHFFVEDDVEARHTLLGTRSVEVDSQKITQLLNELELECDEGIQYFSSLKKRIEDKRRLFFEQTHKEMKSK